MLLAGLREDVCIELAIAGTVVAIAGRCGATGHCASPGSARRRWGSPPTRSTRSWCCRASGRGRRRTSTSIRSRSGPAALLLAPFLHPLAFGAAILTLGRLTYVLEALVPLAFVPLRSRLAWLSVPGFAIVLLANSGLVWRMGMHYAALWIPWLLIAFAAGIASLRRPRRWTTIAFVLSAVVLVAFSPLHPLHYLQPSYHALDDARVVLAAVPPDATVATHDEWYTAIAARRPNAEVIGSPLAANAQYIVFATDLRNAHFQQIELPWLRSLTACGDFRLVIKRGAVVAYERGPHARPCPSAGALDRNGTALFGSNRTCP